MTPLFSDEPAYGLTRDVGRDRVVAFELSLSNTVAAALWLRNYPAAAALDREHFVARVVGDEDVRGTSRPS